MRAPARSARPPVGRGLHNIMTDFREEGRTTEWPGLGGASGIAAITTCLYKSFDPKRATRWHFDSRIRPLSMYSSRAGLAKLHMQ